MVQASKLGKNAQEAILDTTEPHRYGSKDSIYNCLAHLRMLGYTSILPPTYKNPGVWKNSRNVLRIHLDFDNHEWRHYLTDYVNPDYFNKQGTKLTDILNGILHAKY